MATLSELIANAGKAKGAPAIQTPIQSPAQVAAQPTTIPTMPVPAQSYGPSPLAGVFQQPAVAQQPLGGGSSLLKIKAALAQARPGSNRNDIKNTIGVGWYLLKNGAFKVTETKQKKLTTFSLICVHPVSDSMGLTPASVNYSGPRKGEEYTASIFQEGSYPNIIINQNLQALQACVGWSADKLKELQSTDEGLTLLMELIKSFSGISMVDQIPTGAPCCFSNQVFVEIAVVKATKDKKDAQGQYVLDPVTHAKTQYDVTNVYWNRKVTFSEVLNAGITEQELVKYFGSVEAVSAAIAAEQEIGKLV